eukprot:145184_1
MEPCELSIFEYSTLLYDALLHHLGAELELVECHPDTMSLCVDMSFFVTSPNQSIHKKQFNQYIPPLNHFFHPNITMIIASYIMIDPSNDLKWCPFNKTTVLMLHQMDSAAFINYILSNLETDVSSFDRAKAEQTLVAMKLDSCHSWVKAKRSTVDSLAPAIGVNPTCLHSIRSDILLVYALQSRAPQPDYQKYQNQLQFSCDDHIVTFSPARNDIINVRTDALLQSKYCINVCCYEKGDELWLGLIRKSQYNPSTYYRTHKHGLFYYGGRESRIRSNGGAPSDVCSGYATGTRKGADCNHGSIQGSSHCIVHPLNSYSKGDWINFEIDFENSKMIVFKNGKKEGEASDVYFPEGDCYFIVEVDRQNDRFYIEQEFDNSVYRE